MEVRFFDAAAHPTLLMVVFYQRESYAELFSGHYVTWCKLFSFTMVTVTSLTQELQNQPEVSFSVIWTPLFVVKRIRLGHNLGFHAVCRYDGFSIMLLRWKYWYCGKAERVY